MFETTDIGVKLCEECNFDLEILYDLLALLSRTIFEEFRVVIRVTLISGLLTLCKGVLDNSCSGLSKSNKSRIRAIGCKMYRKRPDRFAIPRVCERCARKDRFHVFALKNGVRIQESRWDMSSEFDKIIDVLSIGRHVALTPLSRYLGPRYLILR